jgi:hypothetical protein
MAGHMMLSRDFSEFVELLNKNGVEYLVVGGYAVAFHGHPRKRAAGRPQDLADIDSLGG